MTEQPHLMDDRTYFCLHCGQAAEHLVNERKLFCDASPNVVGISHIVRGRRLAALADSILACQLKPSA